MYSRPGLVLWTGASTECVRELPEEPEAGFAASPLEPVDRGREVCHHPELAAAVEQALRAPRLAQQVDRDRRLIGEEAE